MKGGGVYFGIKTLIKDLRLPNDFKWLLKTCSDFQKLLHFSSKNMGMLHIKRKLVIRVTHWKWENGILRSSEVIIGQKPKNMTNRKIFYSTLFMQGAFGTLNKDRGLLFFCFFAAYLLKYIEISKKISLWPLIDLKMTLHCPLKSQNWPQSVVGTLNKVGDLLFPLFSSLSTELHIFKKNCTWPLNDLKMTSKWFKIDLWVCLALKLR